MSEFKTISEVADHLQLPQHVLRFWETQFSQIKPAKRRGGRRFYSSHDLETLSKIKNLLYVKGYTIKGAKKALNQHFVPFNNPVAETNNSLPAQQAQQTERKTQKPVQVDIFSVLDSKPVENPVAPPPAQAVVQNPANKDALKKILANLKEAEKLLESKNVPA